METRFSRLDAYPSNVIGKNRVIPGSRQGLALTHSKMSMVKHQLANGFRLLTCTEQNKPSQTELIPIEFHY